MKTYTVKASEIKRERHLMDASGEILGRLATRIAILLMGKHKPEYVRNMDCGDFVVVINAEKIRVTTAKYTAQKVYYSHSGYPGGLKSITLDKLMKTHPTRAIEYAVAGMLPHTRLGDRMIKKLKVYAGDVITPAPKKPRHMAKKADRKQETAENVSPEKE
ncbi:MAG: 50S ribosomal protein L13 [Chloroflexota bacterium]